MSIYGGLRWKQTRLAVLREAAHKCSECGAPAKMVHHILPIKQGGEPYARDNLAALCWPCHSRIDHGGDHRHGRPFNPVCSQWDDELKRLILLAKKPPA